MKLPLPIFLSLMSINRYIAAFTYLSAMNNEIGLQAFWNYITIVCPFVRALVIIIRDHGIYIYNQYLAPADSSPKLYYFIVDFAWLLFSCMCSLPSTSVPGASCHTLIHRVPLGLEVKEISMKGT